jgi:hypothetical protein
MSATIYEKIKCPAQNCGEVFEAELCHSINVKQNPELKEILLAGELNVVSCPKCGMVFYAEYFVLYFDPVRELLAFVYPKDYIKEKPLWEEKMNDDFRKAQDDMSEQGRLNYSPVIFFGMDELVKLLEFEELQFDEALVLENIHKNLRLDLIRLNPGNARKKHLPPLLPSIKLNKKDCLREEIVAGLRKLLDFMPDMAIYEKTLEMIRDDSLQLSDFVKK